MAGSVLITGSARGLGFALVSYFILQKWKVYALIRQQQDVGKIKQIGGQVIISDVGQDKVKQDIKKAVKGEISVLINNAGVGGDGKMILQTDVDDFSNAMNINCFGVLRVCQAALPLLSKDALIMNISSRFGSISRMASGEFDNIPCSYSYHVAKAAQNMLTQCLSRAYRNTGIRVCAVHPGKLKTEFASVDADKEPIEAAKKIYALIDIAETGKFYDLFEGESTW